MTDGPTSNQDRERYRVKVAFLIPICLQAPKCFRAARIWLNTEPRAPGRGFEPSWKQQASRRRFARSSPNGRRDEPPLFPCPKKFTFWDTTLLPRGTFWVRVRAGPLADAPRPFSSCSPAAPRRKMRDRWFSQGSGGSSPLIRTNKITELRFPESAFLRAFPNRARKSRCRPHPASKSSNRPESIQPPPAPAPPFSAGSDSPRARFSGL